MKKLRALVIAEIAKAHAGRIDDEWARLAEATRIWDESDE